MRRMENSWIPAGKEDAVRRALASAFPGQTVEGAPLTGGASGALLFRIRAAGHDYVLRIETGRDAFRDPARHYACLAIAAQAQVAPPLFYADAEDGVAVTGFIAADPPAPPHSQLAEIARALRRLHDAPLFPPLADYYDGLGRVMEITQTNDLLPPEAKAEFARRYRQCGAAYPKTALEIVSSHNDLNPSNWLFAEGRMWIVDWESAFAADRYVDLGTVANFLDLDEGASDRWLTLYFGAAPDQWQRDRLVLARQMSRLFYAGALFLVAGRQNPDARLSYENLALLTTRGVNGAPTAIATFEGKQRLAGALFNEALAASALPDFAAVLARLARPA
jgi:aminoglycoside phosphotransferase (APT) family kinase protein